MAKRRRKPRIGPPQSGGADFLTGEVGPPTYHMPMPSVKSRGQLIPRPEWQIGKAGPPTSPGEDRVNREREGALPTDRPLVPTAAEVVAARLPRWGEVALAARCARRVLPLSIRGWDNDYFAAALQRAVDVAERAAAEGRVDLGQTAAVLSEAEDAAHTSPPDANAHAAEAVCAAVEAAIAAPALRGESTNLVYPAADAVRAAAYALLAAATVSTPVRKLLLCLRRDFDRLARLAKRDGWTDDTPVPPEVFGPMWPSDLTPEWAKEPRLPGGDPGSASATG